MGSLLKSDDKNKNTYTKDALIRNVAEKCKYN